MKLCAGRTSGFVVAADRRQRRDGLAGALGDRGDVGGELAQRRGREPVLLLEQRDQQVRRGDLGVAGPGGELLRGRDRLLGLDRESVCLHRARQSTALGIDCQENLSRTRLRFVARRDRKPRCASRTAPTSGRGPDAGGQAARRRQPARRGPGVAIAAEASAKVSASPASAAATPRVARRKPLAVAERAQLPGAEDEVAAGGDPAERQRRRRRAAEAERRRAAASARARARRRSRSARPARPARERARLVRRSPAPARGAARSGSRRCRSTRPADARVRSRRAP